MAEVAAGLACVLLLAVLGGCAEPGQEATPTGTASTSSDAATSTTSTTTASAPCHSGTTAFWHEPGTSMRAQSASFPSIRPDRGIAVAEPGIVGAYGEANLSRVIRQGPGATGTLVHLNFISHPTPIIGGDLRDDATPQELEAEFLAFARPLLAADDATLEAWAQEFARSTTREPGGFERWAAVSGPFGTDAFLASARVHGSDASSEAGRLLIEDDGWTADVSVHVLARQAIRVNQDDWVEFFAAGQPGLAGAWAQANATFQAYGWPDPDLADASVRCS